MPNRDDETLDLVKVLSREVMARRLLDPTPQQSALVETIAQDVFRLLIKHDQITPADQQSTTPEKNRFALAIISIVLAVGVPLHGAMQGSMGNLVVGASSFLLGVVLTALAPWGRKR